MMFEHLGERVLPGAPFDVLRVPPNVNVVRLAYNSVLSVGEENHESVQRDSLTWNPLIDDESLVELVKIAHHRRVRENAAFALSKLYQGSQMVA